MYWPNGQRVWHRTSPAHGYDLCYSARPGDPVTLFTAREGLKVETTAAGGARVLLGVLVRPEGIRGQAVLWQVKLLGFANTVTYAVEASESTPESGSPDVAGLRVSAGGSSTCLRNRYQWWFVHTVLTSTCILAAGALGVGML